MWIYRVFRVCNVFFPGLTPPHIVIWKDWMDLQYFRKDFSVDVGVMNPCLSPHPEHPLFLSEPSRAPGRLRARSVSASEVEVTWKPLPWSNNRRRILGYEVKPTHAHTIMYNAVDSANSSWHYILDQNARTFFPLVSKLWVIHEVNYSIWAWWSPPGYVSTSVQIKLNIWSKKSDASC